MVGLAPAAHGGNRTGRIFTGDRSGDWLFAALYRAGLAVQPTSTHAGDGQRLIDARMIAAVRCAPPANKPTPLERDTCAPVARRASWRCSAVAAGRRRAGRLRLAGAAGRRSTAPASRCPRRGRSSGTASRSPLGGLTLLGCFHPSQQNTFTGRLTEPMLDAVFSRARQLADT